MATCILRRKLNIWIDLEMISLFVQIRKEKRDPLSTISVSSAWHLPEVQTHSPKKKSAIRTLPNICFFSPCSCPSTEKKGQRGPHSSQLTEVSIPKLSLHNFCHFGPAPSQDSGSEKKKGAIGACSRANTERKKKQGPKEQKAQGPTGPRAKGFQGPRGQRARRSKSQRVQGPKGPRAKGQSHGQGQRPRPRQHQRPKQRQERKKNGTPDGSIGKKQQRFQVFLYLKSCILISFCVAQFVTIRVNLSGSQHKSYSRHLQYLKYLSRLQKSYHFSSAFKIDHTSI